MSITNYIFVSDDDVWELISNNKSFNDFIGMCISDFVARIVSNDVFNKIIEQDYEIPEHVDTIESSVLLRKLPNRKIHISFCRW